MSDMYILNANGEPEVCDDIHEWGRYFKTADRHVAKTELADGTKISTVFLGVDHAFSTGLPILWETMIFGGPHDQYQDRYYSREQAVLGHEKAVALASSTNAKPEE